MVPCQECGRKVTRECLEGHAASLCSNKRILCPPGCGTSLLWQAIVNLIMQSNVKWLSRPIKYPKVALASSSLVPTIKHKCLFLLSIAPLDASFERVPRKNGLLYSAWLHYHGKAEGCTAALDKCSLCPHCSAGRRGPASAVPDAFPENQTKMEFRRERCVLLQLEGRKVE
ncbi:unnamed protein product [Pocillopora meandrina]|uniref:TRAF-type domain-containing protein n=1 Tax=Pocillopora meandrina TaxID=46732 RepID=A0AAU9X0B0_9CNID|nr:unnamed protein product [Pocillopora meandrina]